jgi:hypothetical protein
MPIRPQAARKIFAVYSLPWSVCMITPATASFPPRTATAIASAAWASSASWCSSIAKPTTRREPTSSTESRNSLPCSVAISVPSPYHF